MLASGLANIANNVKPDGSDISIDVPGMSANNANDGFSELKQSLDVKVDGKLVTIDDTTDQYGVIKIDNTWGTGTVDDFYILSNMSDNSSYPYKLTISTVSTAKIGIRFRNQSTNAGITNTAINTKALILKVN